MTVTTAHHSIWKHLYDGMHTAQKPKVKFMFVALDKERNMSTLWRREVFLRICSEKDLAKIGAQKIEVTIPVTKNVKEHVTTLIQCPFFKIISAVNEGFQIVYTLEFEVVHQETRGVSRGENTNPSRNEITILHVRIKGNLFTVRWYSNLKIEIRTDLLSTVDSVDKFVIP